MLVTDFRSLITALGEYPSDQQTTNQYTSQLPSGEICRENLLRYLTEVVERRPKVMLMGEAPGYRGCRLTGIPFTSEQIMLDGVLTLDLLGTQRGYRLVDAQAPVRRESSATIVWDALVSFGFVPLLWAAFPFHPHRTGYSKSNRMPSAGEIAAGSRFWRELIQIMEIDRIIAVGNVAHRGLANAGIEAMKIRHPAHGGKQAFTDGLPHVLKTV
ncbi:uracil-DNA glycosylase [soil metagenome]